jgi:hypothetical protein
LRGLILPAVGCPPGSKPLGDFASAREMICGGLGTQVTLKFERGGKGGVEYTVRLTRGCVEYIELHEKNKKLDVENSQLRLGDSFPSFL